MAFRSFQTRIVVSFLILITLVQVGTVIAVYSAIQRSARTHVKGELVTAAKVVTRLFDARHQRLVEAARILLSADFAFKQAVALGDRNTLLSAMDNHRTRMGADTMLVGPFDRSGGIDTLHRDGAAGGRAGAGLGVSDRDAETLVVPLPPSIGAGVQVALEGLLADGVGPCRRLGSILLGLLVVPASVSIVGGAWIARGVSRPVRQLA